MKTKVYRNLHKQKLSLVQKGLVVDHQDTVVLKNPSFRVQPAGRAKVLREKRKNVHAYVTGELVDDISFHGPSLLATYNPYKYKSFVLKENEQPIHQAQYAIIHACGMIEVFF